MKQFTGTVLLGMTLALTLASCTSDNNPAQQYGNTMVRSLKSAQKFDKKVNVDQVRRSIQEFNAANGRYPADLDELAKFNGMMLKSDQYGYDPATGELTEKP